MVVRFETRVPDDPKLALARADVLLVRYGFLQIGEGRYLRASRWGTGGGLRPRQIRTTIHLDAGKTNATAELRTDPSRGPVSRLDRHVWRGEMDDLRAAVEGAPVPNLDRAREDQAAGNLTGATAILMFLVIGAGFLAFGVVGLFVGAAASMLLFIPYMFLPFRMPRYPLANTAPDLSNYPR